MSNNDNPWYKDGLRFKCTGCGECCTGAPGYVWVTEKEMKAIAESIGIPIEDFMAKYVRRVGRRYSLLEKPRSYDCIFLKGKKCRIYDVRPTQCRTFPWWTGNLDSEKTWKRLAKECEGINDDAPNVPYSQIREQLDIYEA